jgi:hypothetical protein
LKVSFQSREAHERKCDQACISDLTKRLDAAYKSVKSKIWEPVILDDWRGKTGVTKDSHLIEFDADHYLVKEEMTHYGAKKLILKHKITGKISEQTIN